MKWLLEEYPPNFHKPWFSLIRGWHYPLVMNHGGKSLMWWFSPKKFGDFPAMNITTCIEQPMLRIHRHSLWMSWTLAMVVKLVVLGSKWAIFEVEKLVQWRFLQTLMLWVGHKYRRSTSLSRVLPRYFNHQQLWCFQLISWCSKNLTPPRFPATCYVILVGEPWDFVCG